MNVLHRHLLIALSCACVLFVTPRVADARLHPGVEAGWNFSSVRLDQDIPGATFGGIGTFTAGFTLEIPLQDPISIQTGLRFVRKGGRLSVSDSAFVGIGSDSIGVARQADLNFTQDYLEIPVLFRHRFMHEGQLIFDAGLAFGFLRHATPSTDAVESIDYSFEGAVGYDFGRGRQTWTGTLRYDMGLGNVVKDGVTSGGESANWKTQGIQLLIGTRW